MQMSILNQPSTIIEQHSIIVEVHSPEPFKILKCKCGWVRKHSHIDTAVKHQMGINNWYYLWYTGHFKAILKGIVSFEFINVE